MSRRTVDQRGRGRGVEIIEQSAREDDVKGPVRGELVKLVQHIALHEAALRRQVAEPVLGESQRVCVEVVEDEAILRSNEAPADFADVRRTARGDQEDAYRASGATLAEAMLDQTALMGDLVAMLLSGW